MLSLIAALGRAPPTQEVHMIDELEDKRRGSCEACPRWDKSESYNLQENPAVDSL